MRSTTTGVGRRKVYPTLQFANVFTIIYMYVCMCTQTMIPARLQNRQVLSQIDVHILSEGTKTHTEMDK